MQTISHKTQVKHSWGLQQQQQDTHCWRLQMNAWPSLRQQIGSVAVLWNKCVSQARVIDTRVEKLGSLVLRLAYG